MGTAGGEPGVLLNALKPMLGVVGDIKTPQEVMRVVGMMKDAEKLMSRCVYLNILKATCRQASQIDEKKETLHKFLSSGGWGILNKWLLEFTKSENFPVLLELIEVLKLLPVTVDLLKQGNTGKIMKSMTKLEHADVKKNASSMIKQWKTMIRVRETKKKPINEMEVKPEMNFDKHKLISPDDKLKDPQSKEVSDSRGFMDALNINVSTSPPVKKKRRTSIDGIIKKATLPLDEILKNSTEEKEKPEINEVAEPMESPDTEESSSPFVFRSPAVEAANLALAEDNATGVIIDEGSIARKRNKKKRNITWAPDDQLVKVSYFELMEGEKKGIHAENFSQARQLELMLEKQAMRSVRLGEDRMTEKVEWRCLIPVDNAGVPNFVPGEKSREKFIQAEREKTVLAYIFLTKQSLPDFPSEPDFDPEEHNQSHQPTIIPHDEEQTILPPRKPTVNIPPQSAPNVAKTTAPQSSVVTAPPPPNPQTLQSEPKSPNLVSPPVQNIMTQLLRNNMQQQANHNNAIPPPNIHPNMAPPVPGQPGIIPMIRPPFPNIPPPTVNQQLGNNNINNGFRPPPPRQPSVSLMDAPTPNMPGHVNNGDGNRFQGGRGAFNANGRAGFNNRGGGPVPRNNWGGGLPNQAPPPNKQNGNWDNGKYNNNNFHDENYNDDYNENYGNYNDNYNDEFRGNHNDNRRFGNNGQDDSGDRGRGRGFWRRGDNRPHRGRGNMNNRGQRNNDNSNRGRYSNGKDWSYEDNRNGHNRRNVEWNRDVHSYGNGPNRGRNHRNDSRDNPRPRDDRVKSNKR